MTVNAPTASGGGGDLFGNLNVKSANSEPEKKPEEEKPPEPKKPKDAWEMAMGSGLIKF